MPGFGIVCTLMVGSQTCYSEAGWKTIKSKFLTYFNPIGSTGGTTNKSLERIEMETRRRKTN